jgi:hypothetical protein
MSMNRQSISLSTFADTERQRQRRLGAPHSFILAADVN